MKRYALQLLIAIDQLVNAIFAGHADETLSARAYREETYGRIWARILRPVIDVMFFVLTLGRDREHCQDAFISERMRRHLPEVYAMFDCQK